MSKTTTTKYSVGDKVRVKSGKEHDGMGKGQIGTVQEISTPALGVKFPGMPVHKWYSDDEIGPADDGLFSEMSRTHGNKGMG